MLLFGQISFKSMPVLLVTEGKKCRPMFAAGIDMTVKTHKIKIMSA